LGRAPHPELIEAIGHDEALFARIRRNLVASGIPVESIKAEYSEGQFELVISSTDALRAADDHAVYKLAIREMARSAGLAATFMAKWDEAHGGSSCHLHISQRDDDGRNVFSEGDDTALRHFLGGLQRYARDVFLLWAPYQNSYKRFRPGSFAPASLSWGTDNRTAALRVTGRGAGRHLENRIPGADVNPHLAYAGLLAAGLAGIEESIEPDEGVSHSNAYDRSGLPTLPRTLDEALLTFHDSRFTRDRFSDAVVDHITNFCDKESRDHSTRRNRLGSQASLRHLIHRSYTAAP
jgi:glutamine synthetase